MSRWEIWHLQQWVHDPPSLINPMSGPPSIPGPWEQVVEGVEVFTLPPCREKTQILITVQTGSQTSNNLAPGKVCLWSHWSRKALGFRACALQFSSVQLLSHVQLFVILWTAAHQASLSITNSWSLLKLMSIESVMPSNYLILCHPLLLPSSIFPSIGVFSNESVLHIRWPKYWSFSFNISPSNEHSGLISFRMEWLDLLAVQGTLKSLLQYHSSKASILQCSAFFIVQLSYPYMTTGKTIA